MGRAQASMESYIQRKAPARGTVNSPQFGPRGQVTNATAITRPTSLSREVAKPSAQVVRQAHPIQAKALIHLELPPPGSSSPPGAGFETSGKSGAEPQPAVAVNLASGKRRLGMGRTAIGYPNKKFKAPGT